MSPTLLNKKQFWESYSNWVQKYKNFILVSSLVFASVGTYYSALLYKNLKTDMEELLPESAQSVKDVRQAVSRVGGLNHLSILIETEDRKAGLEFQKRIADELRKQPSEMVARVQDNIKNEIDFFSANRALYMDLSDWEALEAYVKERVRYGRRAQNPFNLGLVEEKAPSFDFSGLKTKYESRSESAARFPDGYFESRDGRYHVVLAFLPGKVTDTRLNQKLLEVGKKIVADLNPKSFAQDMKVGFSGDVANIVEEQEGVTEDLISSGIIVAVAVAAVLLIYFRTFLGVYALCSALFCGVALTFGVSYWVVGYLNANTAFMGSIVIGNGINFGIILMARYMEERRKGRGVGVSMTDAMRLTSHATWTAAVAAGSSYLSLIATDFRGFNQFGIIGGLGMLFCWTTSFLVLPAFLYWLESHKWLRISEEKKGTIGNLMARVIEGSYRKIAFVTVILTLVAVGFSLTAKRDLLETDFTKLRNKWSLENGAGFWGKKVDAVFERYLTPTVILTSDESDTPKVVAALENLKLKMGADNFPISEFKTVRDFLPSDQTKKLEIIDRLKARLTPEVLKALTKEERDAVEEFFPKKSLSVLKLTDLPEGVMVNFRELDGTVGRMIHVYPKVVQGGFWDGQEVIRFAETVRNSLKEAGVPGIIAGQPPLSADLISSIATDGPKATAYALLSVIVLILLIFPNWTYTKTILGALFIGIVWMTGVITALKYKINFLNFIALPITFGIGVDYAVNVVSRYRGDLETIGSTSMSRILQSTGGAVALCSITTIIGYGSLLTAGSQAFVSFGFLAVLGELTCLAAAVISLPALLKWSEMRKQKRQTGEKTAEVQF